MKVAVIGAGAWGGWTALNLLKRGAEVTLYDMAGAGNSRSGSGGASRIIRLVYGKDEEYINMTYESYKLWEELFKVTPYKLYEETGVLWLFSQKDDSYLKDSLQKIKDYGFEIESLSLDEANSRYPQINFEGVEHTYFEKKAGILYANKCCMAVADYFEKLGGEYKIGKVQVDEKANSEDEMFKYNGKPIIADKYIVAVGPWIAKLYPSLFSDITYVSRHEVYYLSVPNDSALDYSTQNMPLWFEYNENTPLYYGMPYHLNMGFKVAYDERTTSFDPDTEDRSVTNEFYSRSKQYISRRFPGLKDSLLTESRVCQYDNSLDGHFIIDNHPHFDSILFLAGSSGHGFKLGPAMGNLVADYLFGDKKIPSKFALNRFMGNKNRVSQFIK